MRLQDEVAIVTGAGQGLGKAFALGLAREGARIVVAELNPETGAATARAIVADGGQAISTVTDVSDPASTEAMAARAVEQFGRIDILVNNAANLYRQEKPWEDVSLDEWNETLAVILTGAHLCARAVWPRMKEQRRGKIINISSASVFMGLAGWSAYTAAKAGVIGLTRTLARELGDYGVCVNVVTPGSTQTEGSPLRYADADHRAERQQRVLSGRCIKRRAVPADLVGVVVFLASHESDFITGQTINVDGGYVMH